MSTPLSAPCGRLLKAAAGLAPRLLSIGVCVERIQSVGGVVAAGGVLKERLITGGRVVEADCVAKERV
jgi:hypothetical protein